MRDDGTLVVQGHGPAVRLVIYRGMGAMDCSDAHVQVLLDALRDGHEAWITEVQQWADDAAAAGDTARRRRHAAHVARLKAMPYPWETHQAAGA
jgi:hypothetical protein